MRGRLIAGAAFLALAVPAAAQTVAPGPSPASQSSTSAPGPDGLDQNSFYLEADKVTRDNKTKIATAEGHVEARYRGRTLRAQTVVYDSNTQVVTAKGDVVVVNPDGTAQFAKEMTLDKDFSAGVALGFSARLRGNVKLAAASLIRRNQDVAELNRAIYTPCDICAKDGTPTVPTWSIQASKVVEDRAHHVIYYHHAVIRVLGVPVFYAPVFWNADPDTQARSGFLAPQVLISHKRGFSYSQPYLWVISPSQDLEISPEINTEVNPLLNFDWRARFFSGSLNARFGVTDEYEFDNNGNQVPGSDVSLRSYVLAGGAFDLNNNWTWGFSAERVSDTTFFDRYDIHGVYDPRGLFQTDSRRLLSQVYSVRQDQDSYLSISALDFQGLRVNDTNSAMPVVAPLIEGRYEPQDPILGGRLLVVGSAVIVGRESQLSDPSLPGTDSRRATGEVDWRRAFTFTNGLRAEPFVDGRFDVYNVTNATPGSNTSVTSGRAIPTAGLDLSYPLIRSTGGTTIVLEPLLEGVASPEAKPNADIPDQDSADFVFDETNLFDPNRAPGFDVYDSGLRLNAGGRATIDFGGGRQGYVFFGRSFRSSPDLTLPPNSGFSSPTSDWIVSASVSPFHGVSIYDRTSLDGSTGALRHEEVGVNLMTSFLQGYVRYLHDTSDPQNLRHSIDFAGDMFLTKHWGVAGYATYDLQAGLWARRDIGVFYENNCARIEVVYHYEAGFAELGPPSKTVLLRLTLATLGQQGYRDAAGR
jgi:LPS-assembly protein